MLSRDEILVKVKEAMVEVREDITSLVLDICNGLRYADYFTAMTSNKDGEATVVSIFVNPYQIELYAANPENCIKSPEEVGEKKFLNAIKRIPAPLHYESENLLCDIPVGAIENIEIYPAVISIITEKGNAEILDIIEEAVNKYILESPKYFTRGC